MPTKLIFGFMALLLVVGTSGAAQQDKGKKPPSNECDCKKAERTPWCDKCGKFLEKDDLDKEKKCKGCSAKPKDIEACVKRYYHADCHPDKYSEKPFECCKKMYDTLLVDKAKISYKCNGCMATGNTEGEVQHPGACKNKSVVKVCSKSGQKPHVKDLSK